MGGDLDSGFGAPHCPWICSTPFHVTNDRANLSLNLRKSAIVDGVLNQVVRVHRNLDDKLIYPLADDCIRKFGAPTQNHDRFSFTKWARPLFLRGVFPTSTDRSRASMAMKRARPRPHPGSHSLTLALAPSLAFRAVAINWVLFRCTARVLRRPRMCVGRVA